MRANAIFFVFVATFALACQQGEDSPAVVPSGANTISVTGSFSYDSIPATATRGLDYASITPRPGRGLVVEAISSAGALLASGVTNDGGTFSLSVPADVDYFVLVKAQLRRSGAPGWNLRVVDNAAGGALYAVRTAGTRVAGTNASVALHAPSGWDGVAYTSPRLAAPYAILDVVQSAIDMVVSANAAQVLPPLDISWSERNVPRSGNKAAGEIGSSHFDGTGVYLLGAADSDTDEYDTHVVAHEFGHYLEHLLSRSDSIGGPHFFSDRVDPRLAFGEGYGNAISGMVTGSPLYVDSKGPAQGRSGVSFDLEENALQEASEGWWNEISVAVILYDLFDDANEGMDDASLGFAPILRVLAGRQRTTASLTTLLSFIAHLKAENPALAGVIDALVADEGIATIDDEWDENDSAALTTSGPLYTRLSVGAAGVERCGTDSFGKQNKHMTRRFFRFEVATQTSVTITATPTAPSDSQFVVWSGGVVVAAANDGSNPSAVETATFVADPGQYVIEVAHLGHLSLSSPAEGERCFTLSVR